MCDYSLHAVKNRPAVVDDKLVVSTFMPMTWSKGLASAEAPGVAVCLLPGTEVAFDPPVTVYRKSDKAELTYSTGVFAQFGLKDAAYHRDMFAFPDGESCLIQDMLLGARLTVLQLPAPKIEAKAQEPAIIDRRDPPWPQTPVEQSRTLEPIA